MEPSNCSTSSLEKPLESIPEERRSSGVSHPPPPPKPCEDLPRIDMMSVKKKHLREEMSTLELQCSSKDEQVQPTKAEVETAAECVRERLKKHRIEMAGRVWIPEIWGQESLLKDWADCSAFDSSLVPKGLMMAREALVEEGRRKTRPPPATPRQLRVENRW